MRLTPKMQLVIWTSLLLFNLKFVYRFYLDGLPLIPIGHALSSAAMIAIQLRTLAKPAWLQRTFTVMSLVLLAGSVTALLFISPRR